MLAYIIILSLILLYTLHRNVVLCVEKEELRQELHQSNKDLIKLKMLNKLKVDWDGEPIRAEAVE